MIQWLPFHAACGCFYTIAYFSHTHFVQLDAAVFTFAAVLFELVFFHGQKHIHLPNKTQTKYFQRNQFPVVCARKTSTFLTLLVIDCDMTWYTKTYTINPHPSKIERKRYQPYFGCHLMMTSSCSQQHQDAEITTAINIANYTIKWL